MTLFSSVKFSSFYFSLAQFSEFSSVFFSHFSFYIQFSSFKFSLVFEFIPRQLSSVVLSSTKLFANVISKCNRCFLFSFAVSSAISSFFSVQLHSIQFTSFQLSSIVVSIQFIKLLTACFSSVKFNSVYFSLAWLCVDWFSFVSVQFSKLLMAKYNF